MDWNEWNRQLQNRVSDPGTRYMLGLIYERLLDVSKQVDASNEIVLALAQTMNGLVGLNEIQDGRMKELRDLIQGQVSGVSVQSEPITN
jgi:hypothetical protein